LDAGKWGPNSGSSESLFFYVPHTGASGPHVCQAVGGRASIGSVWQTLMWWPPPTSGDGRWFEALSNANGTGTNALTSGPVPRSQSRIPGVTYDYLSGTEGSGSHRRAAPRLKRACIETSLMVDASPFRVPRSR
jgi:hypothetical protein